MSLPTLYSLRRCPYCVRARLVLLLAQQPVMLRDVVTVNLPDDMLKASPKGTVPVLVCDDSSVIDESLDIMIWALKQSDPSNLLLSDRPNAHQIMMALINRNDAEFVVSLDKYKIASRYHHNDVVDYREQCVRFISDLEQRLTKHDYFMGNKPSLADYAILPFISQFSRVDRCSYLKSGLNTPYPNLQRWLTAHYQNPLYSTAMTKFPLWLDSHEEFLFGRL
ncbi:glutathione S-transferase [Photobacterium lutimaris]|uniref:Glutathione S-transferase n=1 Tax=Photobacterium lutimaris TaxID=388278 RepID=A0A2T3J0I9_9GAMM|nr:glutathione S-transferase [Photobacterium lutimaris]PSU34586.1 glutathione S-transferase [Photobacterium lutimaris]TDR71579.1 glutathione S-transferase [Photobacterium lutimaris]